MFPFWQSEWHTMLSPQFKFSEMGRMICILFNLNHEILSQSLSLSLSSWQIPFVVGSLKIDDISYSYFQDENVCSQILTHTEIKKKRFVITNGISFRHS